MATKSKVLATTSTAQMGHPDKRPYIYDPNSVNQMDEINDVIVVYNPKQRDGLLTQTAMRLLVGIVLWKRDE